MTAPVELLGLYLHLARASGMRQQPHIRDKLLVLAAVIAVQMRLPRIAGFCRSRILTHNPHHLVRRWPTIELALTDDDFLVFLRQLQRRYPQEKAERLLATLDIERGREREAYFSDEEYAAALLGTTLAALDATSGDAGAT